MVLSLRKTIQGITRPAIIKIRIFNYPNPQFTPFKVQNVFYIWRSALLRRPHAS